MTVEPEAFWCEHAWLGQGPVPRVRVAVRDRSTTAAFLTALARSLR